MDLKPFYELRERLKSAAVAGAGLASEDFRLARAAQAMAPLAAASPVFGRLAGLVEHLLSPECGDRAGALLDAVTLADAILCTQGAVAPEEPVEPLTPMGEGMAVSNAPYSALAPLLESLTSSGNGKYTFVMDTHRDRPQLFKDYRVKEAMVRALGASFGELADQVETWLSAEDRSLLPLLLHGFDPAGKKEMVRRVRVMEAVAGPDANEFYLSRLPDAKKEVRQELIYALRHSEGNAPLLAGLCRTETGGCKKAAHWALAALDAPEAWEYWESLADRKPDQAAEYMTLSRGKEASGLIARLLDRWLEPFEADSAAPLTREAVNTLQLLLTALPGKWGPEICDIYRRMAALGDALDRSLDETGEQKKETALFMCRYGADQRMKPRPFSLILPMILKQALMTNPEPGLLDMAKELGTGKESWRENFASVGLTAALISEPAVQAYQAAQPFLARKGIFKKTVNTENKAVITETLRALYWDEDRNTHVYRIGCVNPANGRLCPIICPLNQPLDQRWYEQLISAGSGPEMDGILGALVCTEDREACARVGEYFYKKALTVSDCRLYLDRLRRCGWTNCEDLAVRYCMKRGKVNSWELSGFMHDMPGDCEARAREAERVLALIEKGEVEYTGRNAEFLKHIISELRNSETAAL